MDYNFKLNYIALQHVQSETKLLLPGTTTTTTTTTIGFMLPGVKQSEGYGKYRHKPIVSFYL